MQSRTGCEGERAIVWKHAQIQFELRIGCRGFKKLAMASREIVPADNALAFGDKPVNKIAVDETSAAGDEYFVHS